jgi:hypothetical protein
VQAVALCDVVDLCVGDRLSRLVDDDPLDSRRRDQLDRRQFDGAADLLGRQDRCPALRLWDVVAGGLVDSDAGFAGAGIDDEGAPGVGGRGHTGPGVTGRTDVQIHGHIRHSRLGALVDDLPPHGNRGPHLQRDGGRFAGPNLKRSQVLGIEPRLFLRRCLLGPQAEDVFPRRDLVTLKRSVGLGLDQRSEQGCHHGLVSGFFERPLCADGIRTERQRPGSVWSSRLQAQQSAAHPAGPGQLNRDRSLKIADAHRRTISGSRDLQIDDSFRRHAAQRERAVVGCRRLGRFGQHIRDEQLADRLGDLAAQIHERRPDRGLGDRLTRLIHDPSLKDANLLERETEVGERRGVARLPQVRSGRKTPLCVPRQQVRKLRLALDVPLRFRELKSTLGIGDGLGERGAAIFPFPIKAVQPDLGSSGRMALSIDDHARQRPDTGPGGVFFGTADFGTSPNDEQCQERDRRQHRRVPPHERILRGEFE